MKRLILAGLVFFTCLSYSYGQLWQSTGFGKDFGTGCLFSDTVNNILYAGGSFLHVQGKPIIGIAQWNGTDWDSIGTGFNANSIYAITKYNGDLYVGSSSPNNNRALLKWDGISWSVVGSGLQGGVLGLTVYNGELYVNGSFNIIGGNYNNWLVKWDGSNWSDVHSFPYLDQAQVLTSIAFYKNQLYVGGNFYPQNNGRKCITRWDGSNWIDVDGGLTGGLSGVEKMLVYKNELYVVGGTFQANIPGHPADHIAKWNGTNWSDVGGGVLGFGGVGNGQIHNLEIFNNELYAVGVLGVAGGVTAEYIAKWDGVNWCGFGSTFDNRIVGIAVHNSELFVAGGFNVVDGDTLGQVIKWIGGNYTDTCGNLTGIEDRNTKNNFNVYPNPNNGSFIIETNIAKNEKVKITLYNVMGESLLNIEEESISTRYQKQIDIEKLPAGVYFLSFQTEGYNTTKKIVRQ